MENLFFSNQLVLELYLKYVVLLLSLYIEINTPSVKKININNNKDDILEMEKIHDQEKDSIVSNKLDLLENKLKKIEEKESNNEINLENNSVLIKENIDSIKEKMELMHTEKKDNLSITLLDILNETYRGINITLSLTNSGTLTGEVLKIEGQVLTIKSNGILYYIDKDKIVYFY